jgi:hypothetical protein
MVSVLILGMFLVPLAISRNNVILMTGNTISLRKARILAAQKIGELELQDPEELVTTAGDFGEEHPGFLWETKVETLLLGEVVDLDPESEEEEATAPLTEEEEEEPELEVIRLTLVVRSALTAETDEFDEAFMDEDLDEEPEARPGDRIIIVRYFLKEPEEEEEEESPFSR